MTQAFLQINGYDSVFEETKEIGGLKLKGPIYIIDETDKEIHFASKDMENWFTEFVEINTIKKEVIKYSLSQRINDGFPKTKRTTSNKLINRTENTSVQN